MQNPYLQLVDQLKTKEKILARDIRDLEQQLKATYDIRCLLEAFIDREEKNKCPTPS